MKEYLPSVSVIVAVYNVKNYIARCVSSLLAQSYSNFEIVLVDDGSTDGSATICDEFADTSCNVNVLHKANGGLSDARNAGLLVATGEYVSFVDGDDLVAPCYIEQLMRPIVHGGADFAVCDLLETTNPESVLSLKVNSRSIHYYSREKALVECLEGETITVSACGKLGRRTLWLSHLFPVGQVYEDLYTIPFLISQAGVVAHVPEPLYGQVMREGSITRKPSVTEKQYHDYYEAIAHNKEIFENSKSSKVRTALAIRTMTESARLIRLFGQIESVGAESEDIVNKARKVLRSAVTTRVIFKVPFRSKVSVIFGLTSPKLQRKLFRWYQSYKASCVQMK